MDAQKIQLEQHITTTPEEFMKMYNTDPNKFVNVRTSTINKTYTIKDSTGAPYKFTRSKNGPKVIRNYSVNVSKASLEERIVILETRLKELDFLSQRIRDLEEIVFLKINNNKTNAEDTQKTARSRVRSRSKPSDHSDGRESTATEDDL